MNDTQSIIVQLLRQHGSLTRDQISHQLGLSAMGTSKPLMALNRAGLVTLGQKAQPGPGRPFQSVQLSETGGYSLGLVIRRLEVHFALVSLQNKVVDFKSVPFSFRKEPVEFARLLQTAAKMVKGLPKKAFFTAGLSFSGDFETDTGHILRTNDFSSPGQAELFRQQLSKTLGTTVTLLHDIDASLIAERWCNPDLPPNPTLIFVGDRLGVSIMIDGHLCRGKARWPRWLGRIQVPFSPEKPTNLLPGALAGTASLGAWIARLHGENHWGRPDTSHDSVEREKREVQEFYELWQQHDPRVIKLVTQGAKDIAAILRNLCLIFPFDRVICHGWVPDMLDLILKEIRHSLDESYDMQNHEVPGSNPPVSASILGSQNVAAGTALGAFDIALEFKMAQRGRRHAVSNVYEAAA